MLEHAIEATTYPDDIVLDCFSGSGNTAMAALKLGRRVVLMEIDPVWVSRSAIAIEMTIPTSDLLLETNIPRVQKIRRPQSTLFA